MNKVIQTSNLKKLIRIAGHPAYKTVEALAVGVAGDLATGTMLYRLLRWMPHSKRRDGSVYKSAADWRREAGLTEAQVKRAKKRLIGCGVKFGIRKANGVPKTHYQLDPDVFLHQASALLELPPEFIFAIVLPEPSGEGNPMDQAESANSLTHESNNESNNHIHAAAADDQDAIFANESLDTFQDGSVHRSVEGQRLLKNVGVHYPMYEQLARQHDLPTIRAAIALARQNADKNPPGFIVDALQQGWVAASPSPTSAPPPPPPAEEETEPDAFVPEDITEEAPALPVTPTVEDAAWRAAYQQLELQLDRASFDTFLRKARLIAVEGQHYTVEVHTTYAQTMLQHRLYRNVQRILSDAAREPVEITFVVGKGLLPPPVGKSEMPLFRILAQMNE